MRTRSSPEAGSGDSPVAVIVGLDCITGLQTARVLNDRGVRVVGVAARRDHFCCRTNAVRNVLTSPLGGAPLVETLLAAAGRLDRAVLIPCTDESVLTISRARDALGKHYAFGLPDHETVELLMDKERFGQYAEEQGLPIPRTRRAVNRAQADAAADALRYPVVLKPRLKTAEWLRHARAKAFKVQSKAELIDVYDRYARFSDVILLQEWIEGGEDQLYSVNCYYDGTSTPRATFVARKLRQWPPQTGTSSLGEECRNDVVLAAALDLFGAVGYRGFGYIEMKRDVRTGEHFFVEPNVGRPTGRSTIAEAGGVELHYAAYCDLAGLPPPAGLRQRYGDAKWIYLRHDMQAALHAWRSGDLTVREWWRSMQGVQTDAVLRVRDLKPFAADMLNTVAAGMRSIRRN